MKPDVVVVGAGVAGLACAAQLSGSGVAVTVLEARSRIGGRILTLRTGEGEPPVELGAQVVHGDRASVWDVLGQPESNRSWRDAAATVVLDGRCHPMAVLRQGGVAPWELEQRIAAEHPGDTPVSELLEALGVRGHFGSIGAEWLRQTWGAGPDELSAEGITTVRRTERCGRGEFVVDAGYDTVTRRLAEGLDIRTDQAVHAIHWAAGGATIEATGCSIRARRVVVTVPPPVVASGRLCLDPLPEDKERAAAALPLGDAICVAVALSQPATESAVVFDADGHAGFWRATAGSRRISAVAKGATAQHVRCALRSPPMLAELLHRALPWTSPAEVLDITVADWGSDPWTTGAFTFPRVGALGAARRWAEPIDGTVFFAGEATCSERHMASVHGALESGLRAAKEVADVLHAG